MIRYLIGILIVSLVSCTESEYEGFSISETGLNYKLEKIGDGERYPTNSDYVTINYQIRKGKEQVLKNSRLMFRIKELEMDGGVLEAMSLLREGDSMSFYMNTKEFFKDFIQDKVPNELKSTQSILVGFKLDKLHTEEEFLTERKKFLEWLITNDKDELEFVIEQQKIEEFISQGMDKFSVTPTGLYYSVLQEGNGDQADFGQSVLIHYEGFKLDGTKFDSTRDRKSWFEFILGNEGQVIKGIEEGLFLMNEGSKYKFVIPSYLAYGEKGTINGVIEPNTPVVYIVELIKKN